MKHQYLMIWLLAISLSACMGGNSAKKSVAVYDLGLASSLDSGHDPASETAQRIQANIEIEKITAAESLNQLHMRYRLNDENPARVFFYSESRWLAPPAELLATRLSSLVQLDGTPANCALKLKLQLFDQLFTNTQESKILDSKGLIQLDAVLLNSKTRKVLASTVIMHSEAAPNANAHGGVQALAKASDAVLIDAVNWANAEAGKLPTCQ